MHNDSSIKTIHPNKICKTDQKKPAALRLYSFRKSNAPRNPPTDLIFPVSAKLWPYLTRPNQRDSKPKGSNDSTGSL